MTGTKSLLAVVLVLMLLPFALTGCGGSGASSPTDAVKGAFEAGAKGDVKAALSYMAAADIKQQAARTRKLIKSDEESAKEWGLTGEEADKLSDEELLLKDPSKGNGMDVSKIEYLDEKIDGDKATVKLKMAGNAMTMNCVKEDGSWKVTMQDAGADDDADEEVSDDEDSSDE